MQKSTNNSNKRDSETATRVKRTADLCGVSTRYVYMVIIGDRVDENVLSVYMQLAEGENKLLESVRKVVPFN